jgi:branched-chain amino acid transport system permease protein
LTPARAAAAALQQATRWQPAEIIFWLVALASWFLLPGFHLLLNEIAIYALFALSLDLILGYAGIISLGQAAFFGVGAYAAGLLAKAGYAEPIFGLVAAGAACALLGSATSFLVLRGTDLTRIMVTLSVAAVLYELANRMQWLTGGADGLQGIAMAPLLSRFEFDIFGHVAYAYTLGVLFVLFLAARRVVFSPFGWSVRAVKGNALRTASLGIPVTSRLIGVYTLAAAYAGIAGALLAQTTQFVSLDVFSLPRSADPLLMVVIGGTGYLYGGLIGAVAFKVLQNWLSDLTPEYWQFWLGSFLVLLVLAGRERLFTLPPTLLRVARR